MNLELLLEAERRGILPPDKGALLAEARRRGLVAGEAPPPPAEKGFWQTAKENIVGDNDPTTQNFGEKVGTAINKGIESLTFGLVGDEADAAMAGMIPGGMGYDERLNYVRDQERMLEQSNPGAALSADVGGAVVGALSPMGAIGTLSRGARLLPKIGASAATGAGMGGLYGFMEGEGDADRLDQLMTGMILGGSVGAVAPAIGGGVQKIADARAQSRAIRNAAKNAPTSEQLRATGRAAYDQIDNMGVQINPQAFDVARQNILNRLRGETGFDELPGPGSLTPNSARVMEIMGQASNTMAPHPTAALPFRSVDQMRRQAGTAAGNVANKTDQQAGMTIIEGLDDFVQGLGPQDVIAGDVQALKTAIPKARDIWTRMSKSQLIDDAMDMEGNYLSGGASAIRNRVASILRNPKLSRGFTDAEKKVLQRVVSGSLPQQMLNYLGSGLGMMGQMGLGAMGGGLPGAIGGAAMAGLSRKGSEALTRRQAETARSVVANGGLQMLPVATDAARRKIEALLRRSAASVPQ